MFYLDERANEEQMNAEDLYLFAYQTFNRHDRNGNGSLDRQEFCEFYSEMGDGSIANLMFDAADLDKNGTITFDEFWNLFVAMYSREYGNISLFAKLVFDACDKGNKGYLTKEEFAQFYKMSSVNIKSDTFLNEQVKFYDENSDGKITFDEIISAENLMAFADQIYQKIV